MNTCRIFIPFRPFVGKPRKIRHGTSINGPCSRVSRHTSIPTHFSGKDDARLRVPHPVTLGWPAVSVPDCTASSLAPLLSQNDCTQNKLLIGSGNLSALLTYWVRELIDSPPYVLGAGTHIDDPWANDLQKPLPATGSWRQAAGLFWTERSHLHNLRTTRRNKRGPVALAFYTR